MSVHPISPLSVGIAIALSGCDYAEAGKPVWSECVNSRTGERAPVIDDWANRPTVRDARGYEFRVDTTKTTEWRCKPAIQKGGAQ